MRNSKLTRDFWYSELFGDRIVRPHQVMAGAMLCASVLQPIRNEAGPMTITRGLATPEQNAAAGGSATSMHLYGGNPDEPTTLEAAADVNFDKMHGHDMLNTSKRYALAHDLEQLFRLVAGEFIWYTYTCHWHLGLRNARNEGQMLVSTSKKTYVPIKCISDIIRLDPRLQGVAAV